jgi:HlyD family secretion protein
MATNGKRKKKRLIIFSILGGLVVLLVIIAVLGSNREEILPVQVEKAQRRTITQVVTATGKIQPEVMVKISPEVSGEIVELPVKEGQRVRKGELLLRIKPDFYTAQRDQSAAALMQAKATLDRNESEFRRMKDLYEKGLVSESEYDFAFASFETSKASHAQAVASLNQVEESVRKTTVISPMNGTVSQLNSELGERVLGTNQFQGTEVMVISDLSKMEARVEVSETDVVLASVGDTARISVDALPNEKINAVVYEIANTGVSRGLGTQEEVTNFEVKMRIVDPPLALRPGMSMVADIETETRPNVLTVPIQSVTIRTQGSQEQTGGEGEPEAQPASMQGTAKRKTGDAPKEIVFVVRDGLARSVPVGRGISNDSYIEITEGLEEGVEVVSGSYKAINRELEDSTRVRIESPEEDGPKQGDGSNV